jgi:hypothetical protein
LLSKTFCSTFLLKQKINKKFCEFAHELDGSWKRIKQKPAAVPGAEHQEFEGQLHSHTICQILIFNIFQTWLEI